MIDFVHDDGGRAEAGFKGTANDCGVRALAIATGRPYKEVYDLVNEYCAKEKPSKTRRGISSSRTGLHTVTMRKICEDLGAIWVPTMAIGSGTTIHVNAEELPVGGRYILRVSKHYVAYVDGILKDNHNPARDGTRAVYGYWSF